jgi:epoxyqueuosine reductase QueG
MGFIKRLQQYILEQGYEAVVPQQDERWWQNAEATVVGPDGRLRRIYSTNWSERHAAFGAGLGTFSLTGNFITEKGTAGRLVSLVTSAPIKGEKAFLLRSDLPGIYDNCTLCGACKKRCPVGAIPDEPGTKIILTCRTFMGRVSKARTPLWGCGLCQAAIPCEHTNPARKKIV